MFVSAVRSVVEPLFALLYVLRAVAACRGMRKQRSSEQAGKQAGHCRLHRTAQSHRVLETKDTLI